MMIDRRHYAIIPARAVPMIKRGQTWRVLAALGHYASGWGICYPNQRTLGEMAGGMDQTDVSRAVRELHEARLLRMLLPAGKKHPRAMQRGNRYQILYYEDQPLPSAKELEIGWGSRTNRW